jgi:hypothetical protein
MEQCGELSAPIRVFRDELQVCLIISNGLTALRTSFVVPGMRCAAIFTTPPLVLHFQPFFKALFPDQLHVSQYTLPVRVLCIRNKLLHAFAGDQFFALIAKLIAFALSTSLDAAGGAKPGGFLAFASVALPGIVDFPGLCCQQGRAGAAIHAAISIHYIVHMSFSF